MRAWFSTALVCLALAEIGWAADVKDAPIVMEDRPLTAMGQHSPALCSEGNWIAYLRYVVGPDGEVRQALCMGNTADPGMEKRITTNSLVYHPSWRVGTTRIVCVAIPADTKRRPGIYEIDASGDSDPIVVLPTSRSSLPYAPTVSPDDRQLAYFTYSNDPAPARRGEIVLSLLNFSQAASFGEVAPYDKEPFRLSEGSGPWWHGPGLVRVLGERRTEKGLRKAVYEYSVERSQWRRVFEIPDELGIESMAWSPSAGTLAYLREGAGPSQMDVVLCGPDGKDPKVLTTVARPMKQLPRPFPNDVVWLPDGSGLIVVSGGNLRLLRLGKASEADERVCRDNLRMIYRAFQRFAYDHGGQYPPRPAGVAPDSTEPSTAWVGPLLDVYLDNPSALYCPFDGRPRSPHASSYVLNPWMFGRNFDQEALKRDLPILWEADAWHEGSALVLYADGHVGLVQGKPTMPGEGAGGQVDIRVPTTGGGH